MMLPKKPRLQFWLWCAIRLFVWLDNFCYKALSRLAEKTEGNLHPKHRIMQYHRFFVDRIKPTDRVLDIGCGQGQNAYDMADRAQAVTGIDIKSSNIAIAQQKYRHPRLSYVLGDATNYHFEDHFSKVVLSNVLEHINNRVEFLQRLHSLTDTVLLRVPMIDRDWLTVFKKELGLEYRLSHDHTIEYTLPILQNELANGGWDITEYSIQFGECWGVLRSRNS